MTNKTVATATATVVERAPVVNLRHIFAACGGRLDLTGGQTTRLMAAGEEVGESWCPSVQIAPPGTGLSGLPSLTWMVDILGTTMPLAEPESHL